MQEKTYNFALYCLVLPALLACLGAGNSGQMAMGDFRTRGLTADGKASWKLNGGGAVTEGDTVNLDNATLTFITETKEQIVATSPKCVFSRQAKTGSSDAPLHVVHRQATVDGVGYDVLAEQQQLHIRSKVKMTIRPEKDAKKAADPVLNPGMEGDVDIVAESADMDIVRRTTTLTGNVVVTDPRLTMKAEKMVVTFDAQQKPLLIEATGSVTMDQADDDRHGTAGKAEYFLNREVIVLTEKPCLKAGGNTMKGMATVTYYRKEGRAACEGRSDPAVRATIFATPPQKAEAPK